MFMDHGALARALRYRGRGPTVLRFHLEFCVGVQAAFRTVLPLARVVLFFESSVRSVGIDSGPKRVVVSALVSRASKTTV